MFKNILITISAIAFIFNSIAFADIKFWTTETQPARMAKQEEMAKAFEAKTGIGVEVIPIDEKDLGTRATAAAAAGDLPDVIYHTPVSYTHLRAHETSLHLVCRLLLEKKK